MALERLRAWWRGSSSASVSSTRWVVVDVETSGLDPSRADLLAIAAVALHLDANGNKMSIALADSFEVEICPPRASDKANVLIHGIGHQRQFQGLAPAKALAQFLEYVNDSPLLAFHAQFDQTMLARAAKLCGGETSPNPWLDVAHVCRVIHQNSSARSLDDWMSELGVVCTERHRAASDALAEAQIMLMLWPKVRQQAGTFAKVQHLAEQRRWLGRE